MDKMLSDVGRAMRRRLFSAKPRAWSAVSGMPGIISKVGVPHHWPVKEVDEYGR
jgi:hypothetical protein